MPPTAGTTSSMTNLEGDFTPVHWDDPGVASKFKTTDSSDANPTPRSNGLASTSSKAADTAGAPSSLTENGLEEMYPSAHLASIALAGEHIDPPKWQGYLMVQVYDPRKEGAIGPVTAASSTTVVDEYSVAAAAANGGMTTGNQGKDVHVSYGVRAETNLPHFDRTRIITRRRYRDFEFLHDALRRDLPACLVPPLPDKHRLEYVTGDRFSPEFIERRTQDLQIFLERVCRHPHLMRMPILRSFLESTEWAVDMHAHLSASHQAANLSATGDANKAPGLLDNWSDAIVNVFTKVKKPDERFAALCADMDRFEEGMSAMERTVARGRNRSSDLAIDYDELGVSLDRLRDLETGMAPVLRRFSATISEFAYLQRIDSVRSKDETLARLQALSSYGQAFKQLLRTREGKQVDFEELTDYLSAVVAERDRLASLASPRGLGMSRGGVRGAGVTGYLRDQLDAWRGVDEERTRVERMQRLDARIKELQDAVASSHEVLQAFSQQVLTEWVLFEYAKRTELQLVLSQLTQSKVDLYAESVEKWNQLLYRLGGGAQQ